MTQECIDRRDGEEQARGRPEPIPSPGPGPSVCSTVVDDLLEAQLAALGGEGVATAGAARSGC